MDFKTLKRSFVGFAAAVGLGMFGSTYAIDLDALIPAEPGGSVAAGNTQSDGSNVNAQTMEEGFQVAHQQLMNQQTDGVRTITVGSGIGILSTGTSSYNTYENINATLLSKRAAYNRAAMVAKQGLISFFNNPQQVCENIAESTADAVDTGAESLANTSEFSLEGCATEVSASLSGYTTFDVYDDADAKTVRISLISTDKTRDATKTNVGGHMVGSDVAAMTEMVLKDLMKGVLPPMGGKVIALEDQAETVVLGFGSAINRQNSNATIQRRLAKAAQQQARMRANSALLGILTGEDVYHKGSFEESQIESSEQFVADPALEGENGVQALEEEQSSFMSVMSMTDTYRTAVDGELPKGVVNRSFPSNDGHWTYAIAVFSPSLRDVAEAANAGNSTSGEAEDSGPDTRSLEQSGPVDDAPNPTGPSGTVSNADSL